MTSSKKIKYITPPNHLKQKVGSGGIPQKNIERAQNVINAFSYDFRPIARKLSTALSSATQDTLQNIEQKREFEIDKMLFPIMQLKANGSMFNYDLLTDVADICLQFMESIGNYNKEAIQIIKAHEHAIEIIIKNDLKGNGGEEGYILVKELHMACTRYFKKYKI